MKDLRVCRYGPADAPIPYCAQCRSSTLNLRTGRASDRRAGTATGRLRTVTQRPKNSRHGKPLVATVGLPHPGILTSFWELAEVPGGQHPAVQ